MIPLMSPLTSRPRIPIITTERNSKPSFTKERPAERPPSKMASSNEYRRTDSDSDDNNNNNNNNNSSADSHHTTGRPPSTELCVRHGESLETQIKVYTSLFDSSVSDLQALINKLTETTDHLEKTHRSATIGSLSGGVIGAAGGITSIVGVILAPFTLGASLIVTGVGVGVAFAGGVTGAASNITDMVQKKKSRKEIEEILKTFQSRISPIIDCLKDIAVQLDDIQRTELRDSFRQKLQAGFGVTRGAGHAAELLRLANFAEIGRMAAQVSGTMRAAAAMTGLVSGLLLMLDIVFIKKDIKELMEIDKWWKDGSEKSDVVKFIQEMRKTAEHLTQTLKDLRSMKTD